MMPAWIASIGPIVERIGVPAVICGALIYMITVSIGNLERRVEYMTTQVTVVAENVKFYRFETEERVKLLKERRRVLQADGR